MDDDTQAAAQEGDPNATEDDARVSAVAAAFLAHKGMSIDELPEEHQANTTASAEEHARLFLAMLDAAVNAPEASEDEPDGSSDEPPSGRRRRHR